MSVALAHSNDYETEDGLKRNSLTSAFNRAAQGLKPQNPHADGELLISEGFIAQETLKQVGEALSAMLPKSEFEIGPEKDLVRAMKKVAQKDTDLSENCDFSRARHFTSVEQMKTMIDMFGRRGPVTLNHNEKQLNVYVVDVDNTFTTPNPKKPGLCNLDIKLLIPFTLESGEETYHVCELQFLLKNMRKGLKKSHDAFEESREYKDRIRYLDKAMESLSTRSGTAYRRLATERQQTFDRMVHAEDVRKTENLKNAKKACADQLAGYQPCNNNNADFVASAPTKDYIKLVPA